MKLKAPNIKELMSLERLRARDQKRMISGRFDRFGAYFLDYYIQSIFVNVTVLIVWVSVNGSFGGVYNPPNLDSLPPTLRLTLLILMMLALVMYNILFPLFVWEGQTIGKRIIGIKIIRIDGSKATLKDYVIRFVSFIVLQGNTYFNFFGGLFFLLIYEVVPFAYEWNLVLFGGFALSAAYALFHPERRAFHDLLAGTRVMNVRILAQTKPNEQASS
jgi:uncharacterized RDD family membrane protein YckC